MTEDLNIAAVFGGRGLPIEISSTLHKTLGRSITHSSKQSHSVDREIEVPDEGVDFALFQLVEAISWTVVPRVWRHRIEEEVGQALTPEERAQLEKVLGKPEDAHSSWSSVLRTLDVRRVEERQDVFSERYVNP